MSKKSTNPEYLKRYIGFRLREARRELGISQTKLGKILKVSHATVGSYERGRLSLSIQFFLKICKVLEKPYSFFLVEDEEIKKKIKKPLDTNYSLEENIEFSLEMALKTYLKMYLTDDKVQPAFSEIMNLIKTHIDTLKYAKTQKT